MESGLPIFRQDFSCPALLKSTTLSTCTGLSPSTVHLPRCFQFFTLCRSAGPISLAATFRVSVDFLSCRYLDVSVPRVRFAFLSIQNAISIAGWVPPFGHPRINAYSQLPTAFRSVLRPSSPLIAKAFTKCPYLSLDSYNINILLSQYVYITSTKNLFYPLFFRILVYISILFYLDFLIIQYFHIILFSFFLIHNVL